MKQFLAIFAILFLFGGASPASAQSGRDFPKIPPSKDNDIKLYARDGAILRGRDAMTRMHTEADVILWLAGNQFFAMDDVVAAFRKSRPNTAVGLITLPPGLILNAIVKGGWTYDGVDYPGVPDIYASVNIGHLKQLKAQGLMADYMIYMHNELQLMVAKGNPKGLKIISGLSRPDIRTSMPNPVNEGIMQFYARKVLERNGLWEMISAGKECVSCQTSPRNWFTAVHHRETPDRIKTGLSDTGIVWRTEVLEAQRGGALIEGVELPPQDSLRNEVSYVVGALTTSKRKPAADAYLAFLATDAAQSGYAMFGFVKATQDELKLRPIP